MDKIRTTFTCFIAYFVMSAVISPLGVISGPIAEHYGISVTAATASFTALTTGLLIGSIVAMFVFDYLRPKTIFIACFSIVILGVAGMYLVDLLVLLPVWLFAIGVACGINLSAAIVVITRNFATNLRASMMLLTDSFYSLAGAVSTALAGYCLARAMHWSSAYSVAIGASLLAIVIAAISRFPAGDSQVHTPKPSIELASRLWPLSVYLVGFAIVAYLIGFGTIYAWIPNYAQSVLSADAGVSGGLVSRLFLGMFVGQLVMFVLVLRINPVYVLFAAATASTALTLLLSVAGDVGELSVLMLALGLATGGLFKLLLSFGTTVIDSPTPRMIGFMIFCASLGTALSPAISSGIVELTDIRGALIFTSGCYVMMLVGIAASYFARRHHNAAARASSAAPD